MDTKHRMRNRIIRVIERLTAKNLAEIEKFLTQITKSDGRGAKPPKMAGSWKDLDDDLFSDFTERLHDIRSSDRQIGRL